MTATLVHFRPSNEVGCDLEVHSDVVAKGSDSPIVRSEAEGDLADVPDGGRAGVSCLLLADKHRHEAP
jgi:hypothetical protein